MMLLQEVNHSRHIRQGCSYLVAGVGKINEDFVLRLWEEFALTGKVLASNKKAGARFACT